MANRHKFSKDELDEYFDRVCIPKSKRIFNVSDLSDADKLSFLRLLQKHELCKVPWENLSQHYCWRSAVRVSPVPLFRKIVQQSGRGGYCMEANYFFHLILVNLGFDSYMAGSRIWHPDRSYYGGWTHVVNIARIGGIRYMTDGGYGGMGPSDVVRLEHDVATTQVAPAQMRLVYEPIAQNCDQAQKVWIYQHRFTPDDAWVPHYCFVDLEFLPEDIESMNFEPWLNPRTFFTHKVVAVRFSTDRENGDAPGSPNETALEGEIDGAVALCHDTLKWRRHGKKVLELRFATDAERVAALEKYFGVTFAPEDVEGIIGTAAEIGAKAFPTS